MKIIKGRNFSRDHSTDPMEAYIVNESAVKSLSWENPIGKRILDGVVIGVIKDFHYQPLRLKILPLWIKLRTSDIRYFSIKINPVATKAVIKFLEAKWKDFSPDYPFSYSFIDERIQQMYQQEQSIGRIFAYLSILAVLIAGMGLVGLSSFTVGRKSKEIGIRKTFGASSAEIVYLLSKVYLKLVLAAAFISFPVAWVAANLWLENFSYRINVTVQAFLISLFYSFLITIISVGIQSFKAAIANPVNSLRHE